jgi:hypothetical protein
MSEEKFSIENSMPVKPEAKDSQTSFAVLEEICEKLGFKQVDLEGLNLTDEERKTLSWNAVHVWKYLKKQEALPENLRYLLADRDDGATVKVIVKVMGKCPRPLFEADILSPAFYKNHGGNHDFSKSEFEANLKLALELPPYPKKEN